MKLGLVLLLFGNFSILAHAIDSEHLIADDYEKIEFTIDLFTLDIMKCLRCWHDNYIVNRAFYDEQHHELLMLALIKSYSSDSDDAFIRELVGSKKKDRTTRARFHNLIKEKYFQKIYKALLNFNDDEKEELMRRILDRAQQEGFAIARP